MFDFPNTPSENQEYTSGGQTFIYKAPTWMLKGAGYAPIADPIFTGDPQAPTPATADSDTSIATTAFVKAQAYAPLAAPTFTGDARAVTPSTSDNDTSIATTAYVKAQAYAPLASPALTGTPTAPTAGAGTNTTQIATTAFVAANAPAGRAMLSTSRNYYVRTDGSDSNLGTSNNAGGAFLTIQKAWDTVEKIDGGGNNCTITLGSGMTFSAGMVSYGTTVGFGVQGSRNIKITGDSTVTVNGGFTFYGPSIVQLTGGFKINCPGSAYAVSCNYGAQVEISGTGGITVTNLNAFACALYAAYEGYIYCTALTLDSTASANQWYYGMKADYGGRIKLAGMTTVLGTPGFMSGFVNCNYNSEVDITAASFTHSVVAATPPYYLQNGSHIVGNASQGAATLPGTAAPTMDNGSWYLRINGGRERLTANRNYYVNVATGSDTLNDGLSAGKPFAHPNKALQIVAGLDLSGWGVNIYIADGAYTSVSTPGPSQPPIEPIGGRKSMAAGDPSSAMYAIVRLIGNVTTPANVTFPTFSVSWYSQSISFEGVSFIGPNQNHSVSGPVDIYFKDTRWNLYNYMLQAFNGAHVCFSGKVTVINSSINSGLITAAGAGTLIENYYSMTWTFDVPLAVSSGVFLVSNNAYINFQNAMTYVYTGAVTGPKKNLSTYGRLNCGTSPPGNSAGTVDATSFAHFTGVA